MKNVLKSQETSETLKQSTISFHHCPTCRCKSHDNSVRLNSSKSQTFMSSHSPSVSLYLGNQMNKSPTTQLMRANMFRSSVFQNKMHIHYSPNKSLTNTNITFTYISPSKQKEHHSSDGKFNTKKFKEKHFPHLVVNEDQPSKSIFKSGKQQKKKENPYQTLYTEQKTPEKHKILKINRIKSKQNTTSQKQWANNLNLVGSDTFTVTSNSSNQYEFNVAKSSPIQNVWQKYPKQKIQINVKKREESENRKGLTPSSQYQIQSSKSSKNKLAIQSNQKLSDSEHSNSNSYSSNPKVTPINALWEIETREKQNNTFNPNQRTCTHRPSIQIINNPVFYKYQIKKFPPDTVPNNFVQSNIIFSRQSLVKEIETVSKKEEKKIEPSEKEIEAFPKKQSLNMDSSLRYTQTFPKRESIKMESSFKQIETLSKRETLNMESALRYKEEFPIKQSNQINSSHKQIETLPRRESKKIQRNDKQQASIRLFKDHSIKQSEIRDLKEQQIYFELAKSLSDQLQLNFDYYEPFAETDQSLSINVSL